MSKAESELKAAENEKKQIEDSLPIIKSKIDALTKAEGDLIAAGDQEALESALKIANAAISAAA